MEQSLLAAFFLGRCTAVISLVHGEGGSNFEVLKKITSCSAKKLNSTAGASCNDKEDELTCFTASWLVSRSYRQCTGEVFGWLACSLHGVTMGFNRRLLLRFLAVLPLVARSVIGSCLQLAFAVAFMVASK